MYCYARKHITLFVTAILLLSSGHTIAANKNAYHDHDSIRQAASDFARQLAGDAIQPENMTISVGKLDRRLRLAKCDQPLEAFSSPNTKSHGQTTIGVRCDGEKIWKLYVPVDIQTIKPVVALKHAVTRNSILRASDLVLVEKDISDLHRGYFTNIKQLVGKHVKHTLKSGMVVTPGHVKNPLAVKKGSTVLILADSAGIRVNMKGKAMKSGGLGDWIPVQNLSSNRKVEGRILRPGVILVTL